MSSHPLAYWYLPPLNIHLLFCAAIHGQSTGSIVGQVTDRYGAIVVAAITADPRLLARFDGNKQQWRIDEGQYVISLSRSAVDSVDTKEVELKSCLFGS